jgi:endonuclease III
MAVLFNCSEPHDRDTMYAMNRPKLSEVMAALEQHYGTPRPEPLSGPLDMILWEIVGYLVDDDRRRTAFNMLRLQTGLDPMRIRATPLRTLETITRMGGSVGAKERAERLHKTAGMVVDDFDGDLNAVLKWPLPKARKALLKFPMVGEPGADKILVFCGTQPVLALDSNGVRTMVRIGFAKAEPSYQGTYRSLREAVAQELPEDCGWLTRAHLLLRQHGQEICTRNLPGCGKCPVAAVCAYKQGS